MAEMIRVEVVAGRRERQVLVTLELPVRATVADAVAASGIVKSHPDLVDDPRAVGVFGRRCRPDRELADGDRVELYRPLRADPKEVRRQLAELERGGMRGS